MDRIKRRNITYATACAGLNLIFAKQEKKKKLWIKEYRQRFGHLALIQDLRENYPDDFKNYLRMDSVVFDILLNKLKYKIARQDTIMRKSISPEARLTATLRYLATGRSFEDLKFSTGISAPSLCYIIPETCRAIYEVIGSAYMKMPSRKEEWQKVAKDFQQKWQFINCGGALDGKHIRMMAPPGSGATYYNYKNFYSIVLLALVGPNYEFLFVDVGKNGRLSDGGVLEDTTFYRKLKSGELNLPGNNETVNNYNFVFICDEAFGLDEHFLKPYAHRELNNEKRIFNYRLSRARDVVENAFGIITVRFRVLHTAINTKHDNICYIILAVCTLHNFLCLHSNSYLDPDAIDQEDINTGFMKFGEWHDNSVPLVNLQQRCTTSITLLAKENRENYKNYFNSEGRVEWQDLMVANGRA